MSNDITSILQTFASQYKVAGQSRVASQPTVTEKPSTTQSDRVTLTNSASKLQFVESTSGQASSPGLGSSEVGTTYTPSNSLAQSAPSRSLTEENAQRPTPAMANMMEAFLTTSDMDSFDASLDLNADGVINFHDLAALRDIEAGTGVESPEKPEAVLHNMTESFFSIEGSKGFDAASDLNDDGMINFQDLAILRSKLENN